MGEENILCFQIKQRPLDRKSKMNHGTLTCVVCESPANGYNFGAIACESCKAFFRRNALKHHVSFEEVHNMMN